MGQHLQLYVSKDLTLDEVNKWCRYRSTDILHAPTAEAEVAVARVMRSMEDGFTKPQHLEHGSKSAVNDLSFLVWEAHEVNELLLQRVALANGNNLHIVSWLRDYIGYVVWGDNDGV